MSPTWDGAALLEPISAEAPCGKSLEDTDTLSSFDAYQIFGQTTLEPAPKRDDEPVRREARKSDRPPNWEEIRDGSLTALRSSKDLRLLAHLGASVLRTEGIPAFVQTLSVASRWLGDYWATVFPRVDEDALFRQNALNCFADPVAVIDGLRRAPLVSSRQHGRFSLRDLEIVTGQLTPAESERRADAGQIDAAFQATAIDELKALHETVTGGLTALVAIDSAMRSAAGSEMAPNLESLTAQLKKMAVVLRTQLAAHPDAAGTEAPGDEPSSATGSASGVIAVGAIKSRQDAIRALDAAAEFFRRNEPSSPVPMFLERAKRLVAKDFLEVLADVAPDALPQARAAGGVREE